MFSSVFTVCCVGNQSSEKLFGKGFQNLKQQRTLQLHLEVVDHMIVQLDNTSFNEDGSLKNRANVESNHKVVCDSQVDFLLLNLELTSHGSLLSITLDNSGNSSENYEGLSNLLGFDRRYKFDVVGVEAKGKCRVL